MPQVTAVCVLYLLMVNVCEKYKSFISQKKPTRYKVMRLSVVISVAVGVMASGSGQDAVFNQQTYPTLCPVRTWTGDCLRVGKPSTYVSASGNGDCSTKATSLGGSMIYDLVSLALSKAPVYAARVSRKLHGSWTVA